MSWTFELVSGPYGGTTEGPVWDGENIWDVITKDYSKEKEAREILVVKTDTSETEIKKVY